MNQLAKLDAHGTASATGSLNKYLCFLIGERTFGVNILKVKEIIEHVEVTPIPMMPDFLWGAINLRGVVVPIIDLSGRLNMAGTELQKRTCYIIADIKIKDMSLVVGFVVDAVSKVADIAMEDCAAPPSFGGNIKNEYIQGLGKVGKEFVLLLNIDKVLSMDDLESMRGLSELAANELGQALVS